MQRDKGILLIVLGILVINLVLFLKIGDIANSIQALNQNYGHIQSNIQSVASNVNQSLDSFTKEQSWITPIRINADKSKIQKEESLLVFDWQIKDFKRDTKVIFHYRNSDSDIFKEIVALSQNNGFFEVQIPMEIKVEPSWEIHVSRSAKSREAAVRMENIKEAKAEKAITCYVSMESEDYIKSSEKADLHIGYLAYSQYAPIQGHIDINGGKCHITIFGDKKIGNNSFESIDVQFYSDDKLLAEKPLERHEVKKDRQDEDMFMDYALAYDAGTEQISHIMLEVKYNNGESFRKEIH